MDITLSELYSNVCRDLGRVEIERDQIKYQLEEFRRLTLEARLVIVMDHGWIENESLLPEDWEHRNRPGVYQVSPLGKVRRLG